MKAMILAAGRGTRMGSLTEQTPKPLLPLAGMPLIEYHIRALASAGIDELVINVAWLGEQIVNAIGEGGRFGVTIEYSQEPEGALETAGGIAHALSLLGTDPFIVINADVWSDFPIHVLRNLLPVTRENQDVAHLVMVPNPEHNPRGDFYFRKDDEGAAAEGHSAISRGRLVSEHSAESVSINAGRGPCNVAGNNPDAGNNGYRHSALPKLTYSGIGVYHPEAFRGIQGRQPLGPLLKRAIDANQVSAGTYEGHWWDVGTPERLAQVERFMKGQAPEAL